MKSLTQEEYTKIQIDLLDKKLKELEALEDFKKTISKSEAGKLLYG